MRFDLARVRKSGYLFRDQEVRRAVMSGNGADMGHIVAMLSDLLAAHQDFRAETRREFGSVRSELASFKAETQHEFTSIRQALTEYHAAVLGHGILISELERRMRRVEEHLNLPPAA